MLCSMVITNLHCTLLLVGWCTSYTQYTINLSAVHKQTPIYILSTKHAWFFGSLHTMDIENENTHTSALAFYAIRVPTAKSGPHRVITIIIMYCIV